MGNKGDKMTPDATLNAEEVIGKLEVIDGVSSKKMFGGYGIFHNQKMFGMITAKGGAYLKADKSNIDDYEAHNCEKHSRMPYYEIPKVILEDVDRLVVWANKSIAINK